MKFVLPQKYLDDELIRVQTHPTLPLRIYNYTESCQYKKAWDEITLQCRGLIVDADDNIVARPFKKFFNYEEHIGPLPEGTPEIIEKMDGSLAIVFWYADEWHVATRGSFISEQAVHAKDLLAAMDCNARDRFCRTKTHLFEVLFPRNRIVVDYGTRDELVYLGSIITETGEETAMEDCPCRQPALVGWLGTDLLRLKELPSENAEGFVIRWPTGFRLKIKFEEYKRLHKLLTGVNERRIWEILKEDGKLNDLLDRVPDEFFKWIETTCTNLQMQFVEIQEEAITEYQRLAGMAEGDRKMFAAWATKWKHPAILFTLWERRDPTEYIWKLIKPPATKPFKVEN